MNVYQSMCVCLFFFPIGLGCGMWDLTLLIPEQCRAIYFEFPIVLSVIKRLNTNRLRLVLECGLCADIESYTK